MSPLPEVESIICPEPLAIHIRMVQRLRLKQALEFRDWCARQAGVSKVVIASGQQNQLFELTLQIPGDELYAHLKKELVPQLTYNATVYMWVLGTGPRDGALFLGFAIRHQPSVRECEKLRDLLVAQCGHIGEMVVHPTQSPNLVAVSVVLTRGKNAPRLSDILSACGIAVVVTRPHLGKSPTLERSIQIMEKSEKA